jgi:dolichyl-diphosphooligosaccharide--protein glycosyltransferase
MSRLMLICGPIVSVLAGYPAGIVLDWCVNQFLSLISNERPAPAEEGPMMRTGGIGSIWRTLWRKCGASIYTAEMKDLCDSSVLKWRIPRCIVATVLVLVLYRRSQPGLKEFISHSDEMAKHMSSPQLAFESRQRDGSSVIIDDYLKGYEWIKANTPADSRVMAWWDYGYQITGVANRTSIADGNTWNHEHIATLGRILTSNEKKSHKAMRHLADYALVWAGGHGDDMGKSPHLARIGNSVFPDHCGDNDPLCSKFSFYQGGEPTPMMAESFLYKAVNHMLKKDVRLNSRFWKEVHTTQHGLMRIYKVMNVSKESKAWIADPANRVCDAPGSWYCVGKYPPALAPLIAKRRNFAQLEDFNKKGQKRQKSAYTKLIEKERTGSSSDDEDED